MINSFRQDWLSNIRNDVLAGLVVSLALIPEAIAFSIIAGVDPKVGLYASFSIATISAFVGGRPGMISAATGAMALVMVLLVKEHGLQYLLAATVLTGVFQVIAGWIKLGGLMRFVSKSVITGFVNALAILIFMAQLPELTNVSWQVYAMTLAGLGIIYLFPSHFWDLTAVTALDKVVMKFRREAAEVDVIGLNEASATMVDRFAMHDKDGPDLLVGY